MISSVVLICLYSGYFTEDSKYILVKNEGVGERNAYNLGFGTFFLKEKNKIFNFFNDYKIFWVISCLLEVTLSRFFKSTSYIFLFLKFGIVSRLSSHPQFLFLWLIFEKYLIQSCFIFFTR